MRPELVRDPGATHHANERVADACRDADVAIECTGVGGLVLDVMAHNAPGAVVCLAGISTGKRRLDVDPAALSRTMVLENDVVFGSVNANRRHCEAAAAALAAADRSWPGRLVTWRVPLASWREALERRPDDVKTVIDLTA